MFTWRFLIIASSVMVPTTLPPARAQNVPGLEEVYIWLLSQIGKPIDQPAIAAAQVVLKSGNNLQNLEKNIEEVMDSQLADIDKFTKELAYGRIPIC